MTRISADRGQQGRRSRPATATAEPPAPDPADVLRRGLAARRRQTERLAGHVDAIAAASLEIATRIADGGRLVVLGAGNALPDARHLALEFLHPVIVGKRAVAAVALDPARAGAARWGRPDDVMIAIVTDDAPDTWGALAEARERGLLTLAIAPRDATGTEVAHRLDPACSDPRIAKEGRVALYHLLWELCHVSLEGSERLAPEARGADTGMEALYPFLGAERGNDESLARDLCASGRAKLETLAALRDVTVERHADELARCGTALRAARDAGAALFAFGNGGSQTDADWLAAWLTGAGERAWNAHSLAADPSVLSALANDVGFERVFARQLAALGRPGDVAVGVTTSGGSANVVAGLAEARRRGLVAVGLAGGDGGRLAREGEADFLFVVPSDSVHRIQEVQATVYHLLDELRGGTPPREEPACDS